MKANASPRMLPAPALGSLAFVALLPPPAHAASAREASASLYAMHPVAFAALVGGMVLVVLAALLLLAYGVTRRGHRASAQGAPHQRTRADALPMEDIPVPVLLYDPQTQRVLRANRGASALLALPARLGAAGAPLPPGQAEDGGDIQRFFASALAGESPEPLRCAFMVGERALPVLMSALPAELDGAWRLVLHVQDVSAQAEQSEALARAAGHDREANLLKSRFLLNMSKEIRSPLNAIISFAQGAQRKPQTMENADIYQKIHLSAQNLLSVINDILDFSKIEAQTLDLVDEEFSLEEVVASAFASAAQRMEDKRIEMLLDMHPDVPCLLVGDRTRVWQILRNLLDNAAKFTLKGHIVLAIAPEPAFGDGPDKALRFTLTDTGTGMTREQLDRLFVPFDQLYDAERGLGSGTGLGMAIIRQLLSLMGGTIEVGSQVGIGTTVEMCIPFHAAQAADTLRTTLQAHSLPEDANGVLLVADDERARAVLSCLLQQLGAAVTLARNGTQALREVATRLDAGTPFRLVLLDYMLGQSNGLEVAHQLKPVAAKLPVVLMIPAALQRQLQAQIHEVGFAGILDKPFVVGDLLRKISAVLKAEAATEAKNQYGRFEGARVILCEDNEINQEVAQGALELFGITPTVAGNGAECLRLLDADPQGYNLILMDLMMPVMDGFAATAAIRTSGKPYAGIPIVAMTANVEDDEVARCRAAGMEGHIGKPLALDDIYAQLLAHLARFRSDAQAFTADLGELADLLAREGIDCAAGVQRFGGKTDKYLRTLHDFALGLSTDHPTLAEALAPEYAEYTARAVHTLKGVSGNLGLTRLYELTVAFEKTLRAGTPDEELYDHMNACADALREVLLRLTRDTVAAEALQAGNADELAVHLCALQEVLDACEPSVCEDCAAPLAAKKWPPAYQEDVARVVWLVEQYEYAQADEMTTGLLKRLAL